MKDKIINSFDIWMDAQGIKSRLRIKNVDNISLEGIARLRELILELAIRGKLVKQDQSDEPANILIKKIADEKERLVKEGKIGKQNSLPLISEEEKAFPLPRGWEFVRFGDTVFNRDAEREPISVDERSTRKGQFDYYGASGVIDQIDDYLFDKPLLLIGEDGANLINRSTAIAFIARGKYWVNNHAHVLDGLTEDLLLYICLHINAITLEPYITGTAQPKMNQAKMNSIVLALPPLLEQNRIVAKVNELMALCDDLEQQETNHLKLHQLLVETLLGTLTRAADAKEFQTAWSRLAQHFDDLFTTEDSIDQLKQTILQLAVMGKLVPQDPKDEPASVLLEKIAEEKESLIEEEKVKRQKPLSEITDAEKPFRIPNGWELVRLGNTGIGSTGKTPSTNVGEYFGGEIPFIGPGQITQSGMITGSDKSLTKKGCWYSEIANAGDIFMVCIGGSIGKSAIVNSKVAFNQQLNCISPLLISTQYLFNAMNSKHFQLQLIEQSTGSATPIINRGKWEELIISLPPLNEQHRIVAKVDQLFALCDRLKEGIGESQKVVNLMANSIVEHVG